MKLRSHHFVDEHMPGAWLYGDSILYIGHDDKAYPVKGFVVQGQPMSNLSAAHLATWRAAAMAWLNALDLSTHIDFYWTVENDYSHFLKGHSQGAHPGAAPIARELMQERLENYDKAQLSNELRYRKLFVFVNLEPAPSRLRVDEEFRRRVSASRDSRMLLSEWKAARSRLNQLVEMARHPFESCGMSTTLLTGKDYKRLFRRILSPHRARLQVPEPVSRENGSLWEETLLADVERRPPFLYFDRHYHAFISMTNLPQETRAGFLMPIFHLSHSDYDITFTLRTTDKQESIKNLQSDFGSKKGIERELERQGKAVNVQMQAEAEEVHNEIRTLTHTPQQIFYGDLKIHIRSPDREELQERVNEAKLRAGYCNGIQATLETIAAPEALRSCLPGWTREPVLDRFQIIKSINAADFIPAHTDFIGTGRPQLLFPTPEGGLMTAHVFTESRPFHNVVVGESGGGKTFLLNSIVTQLVSQGLESLTVISTKDEFGPLMSIYGGEQISFREDHPVFINPCAIAGEKPTEDELAVMTRLLETIFGDEPSDGERELRHARILKAAGLTYARHGPQTRVRHFVETFREGWDHDDRSALERLAMILEPYAKGGLYGEYFDSDTRRPLDLSRNFKFFDFSRIMDRKNLCSVMMMALTTGEALRLAKLPRGMCKALILDECWAFVDSSAGGKFIENALRVYRAFHCAVFLSSQQASDFLLSRLVNVIMNNCHNFFLLRTKHRAAIEVLQKELTLTDELAGRFLAMPNPSEVGYSHFIYVHRAESQHIAGEALNRVEKPEAFLYSTSPNVSQLRDRVIRHAKDPWKAVCRFAAMPPEEWQAEIEKTFSETPKPIQN